MSTTILPVKGSLLDVQLWCSKCHPHRFTPRTYKTRTRAWFAARRHDRTHQ